MVPCLFPGADKAPISSIAVSLLPLCHAAHLQRFCVARLHTCPSGQQFYSLSTFLQSHQASLTPAVLGHTDNLPPRPQPFRFSLHNVT